MTSEQFLYWIRGFFEINEKSGNDLVLNTEQYQIVKEHMDKTFNREPPKPPGYPYGPPMPDGVIFDPKVAFSNLDHYASC